jgi:gamma-glutamylputrescine oxidase
MAGKLIAAAIDCGNEDFDLISGLKSLKFPGGPLLRRPSLVAGMLFYSLRDRLG